MIKFNPENKETLTYGEALEPAMKITDKENARLYFNDYVAYTQKWLDNEPKFPHEERKSAEEICKINLGYFAGYYDNETRKRVEELFGCQHPVFGKSIPTVEEAINAGRKAAR